MTSEIRQGTQTTISSDRRVAVLESALGTFARFGYRKTSMEAVAQAARISRPGLYFLFASKEDLFRAAVARALEEDINEVERILGRSNLPIRDRLLDAFGQWAGRYVGPVTREIAALIDENPDLLGELVEALPRRFAELVTSAIAAGAKEPDKKIAAPLAQTMISTSIGIKYQVSSRAEYLQRLALAIDLLLR